MGNPGSEINHEGRTLRVEQHDAVDWDESQRQGIQIRRPTGRVSYYLDDEPITKERYEELLSLWR